MTHTPGPWKVKNSSQHHMAHDVVATDGRSVGTDWRDNAGLDDARLIAAAPDLLEALTLLRSLVNEGGVPRYTVTPGAALNSVIEEVVDPAIAKAKGEKE
jgi:hypothetical protein